ncbi:MAG: murein biosynthesis integral membrane protein MurJ [Vampirovibrionales bacterium]|nr:murein biosynthesis integral membrane protein MurJ [Vampirovibrionales bacterium]
MIPAKKSFFKAAGTVAGVTLASKLLGALRDWAIMRAYGASLATDAYFTAVQLPSFALILLGGVGGPFHSAVVAVFTKLLAASGPQAEHNEQKARQLANVVVTLTLLVFTAVALLIAWQATPITRLFLQGSQNERLIAAASHQLALMWPVIAIGGVVGLALGLQNTYQHFFWPSLSPAAQSLVMIAILWALPAISSDTTGYWLAFGTVLGSLLQFAMQLPQLWKHGYFRGVSLNVTAVKPELAQMNRILTPALATSALGQLGIMLDLMFAALLPLGAWTAVVMANRLIQLPIGVMQTAFLVPVFPRFTQAVAAGQPEQVARDYKLGVNALLLLSTPLIVILLMYGESLIRLVFEHGAFNAHDTQLVSQALGWLVFLMPAYFARDAMTRVFYAFDDAQTPFWITLQGIVLKLVFNALFIVLLPKWMPQFASVLGVGGICLATVLATAINLVALSWLSRKFVKGLGIYALMSNLGQLTLAGLAMAGSMLAINSVFNFAALPLLPAIGVMSLSVFTGFGVYALSAWALKIPEGRYLVSRVQHRLGPTRPPAE